MHYYQVSLLQIVGLCVLMAAGIGTYWSVIRPVRTPDIVPIAVSTGVLAAVSFTLAYLLSDAQTPREIQVTIKSVRDLPAVMVVCYACLIHARRYSSIRDYRRRRRLFVLGPYLITAGFLGEGLSQLWFRPAFLQATAKLPAEVLATDAVFLVPMAAYGFMTAAVFGWAAWKAGESPISRLQFQNTCGLLAAFGTAALAVHTLWWHALRVIETPPELHDVVISFSMQQVVLIGVVAISITAGLIAYAEQSEAERFAERMLSFLDTAGSLSDRLGNVSKAETGLNLPRECLRGAAKEENLALPPEDVKKADAALLIVGATGTVKGLRRIGHFDAGEVCELARVYDEELSNQQMARQFAKHARGKVPSELMDLVNRSETVARGESLYGGVVTLLDARSASRAELAEHEEWVQLTAVALADGKVLGDKSADEDAAVRVRKRVSDAYCLAKYEIANSAFELQNHTVETMIPSVSGLKITREWVSEDQRGPRSIFGSFRRSSSDRWDRP